MSLTNYLNEKAAQAHQKSIHKLFNETQKAISLYADFLNDPPAQGQPYDDVDALYVIHKKLDELQHDFQDTIEKHGGLK